MDMFNLVLCFCLFMIYVCAVCLVMVFCDFGVKLFDKD